MGLPFPFRVLRVLVADSHRVTVDFLAFLLNHWGHEPVLAFDEMYPVKSTGCDLFKNTSRCVGPTHRR
jgi:hypothetical protein